MGLEAMAVSAVESLDPRIPDRAVDTLGLAIRPRAVRLGELGLDAVLDRHHGVEPVRSAAGLSRREHKRRQYAPWLRHTPPDTMPDPLNLPGPVTTGRFPGPKAWPADAAPCAHARFSRPSPPNRRARCTSPMRPVRCAAPMDSRGRPCRPSACPSHRAHSSIGPMRLPRGGVDAAARVGCRTFPIVIR